MRRWWEATDGIRYLLAIILLGVAFAAWMLVT